MLARRVALQKTHQQKNRYVGNRHELARSCHYVAVSYCGAKVAKAVYRASCFLIRTMTVHYARSLLSSPTQQGYIILKLEKDAVCMDR